MPNHAPRVTLVVTPRERFGAAEASLDSVLATAGANAEIVYVSGRAPRRLADAVDTRAAAHGGAPGFRHLEHDRLLSPNEARNIGAAAARGEYVVFIDNDVFCAEGWLDALVACADETGADVVAPLTCHGAPLHTVVHQAGGEFAPDPQAFFASPRGEREIVEVMHDQNRKVAELSYERGPTQLCEFHCVLVRKTTLERIGPFDEEILATKEHLDFCMNVIQGGGTVMFEPRSVVTYLFPTRSSPLTVADWPYFLVRWSPEWQRRSLAHFQRKWGLKDEGYLEDRERRLGWRHDEGIVKAILRKVPLLGRRWRFQQAGHRVLRPLVRRASAALVAREDRARLRAKA